MSLSWLAQFLFFGSYFVAWVLHAFDPLTSVSSGAHTFIVISAIAALVTAVVLLFDNRAVIVHRQQV